MKELSQSLENYLLAIYELVSSVGATRVRDVAAKMAVGAASASEAVRALTGKEFINYQPYGVITLAEKGKKAVNEKLRRRNIIRQFLENNLLLDGDYTEEIEFAMPDKVLERFVDYLTFMNNCSCKEPKWLKSFQSYIKTNKMPEKCLTCTEGCQTYSEEP